LEADRMGALLPAMTQVKLDTQRDVVKNERRWSVDNQPYGTWWEKLPELAYPDWHPFHHSLIGSMEDLSAASLEDVEQFFRTYYTPDNAVLSIAGDFETDEVKALVGQYFGPIPKGKGKPPLERIDLPPKFGETLRKVVEDDVSLSRIYMAFRSPVFGSDEYYPASVCGAILGMRRGSRLYRSLVRERQIAADASAFTFDLAKGSDILVGDVTALPDTSPDQLEAEVEREIDKLANDGVTAEEVVRAVALIETDMTTAMQSAGERADRMSMFATLLGDPGLVNIQADRYRSVTAAQVNAFASDRLGKDNRATLLYVPRPEQAGDGSTELLEVAAS
ncbi:MAG: M16 family metallopeptidase, partial [Gemmatimonadaceae bacterium]